MKKSEGEATTAKSLEEKFDRGEDVLEYFDVRKARVLDPQSKGSAKANFAYPVKRNSTPPRYRSRKTGRLSQKEVVQASVCICR